MGLNGGQQGRLKEGLLDGFKTRARLDQMVGIRCDRSLAEISEQPNLNDVVWELIRTTEAEGWTAKLLAGAREANPGNPVLAEVASELQLAVRAPARRELEVMINRESGMLNPNSWRERLGELEARVCRLRYPYRNDHVTGTGFLVGPDLLMTNHHVIEPLEKGEADPAEVIALFDYKTLEDGSTVTDGVSFSLDADWRVDSSPPSSVDTEVDPGTELPSAQELDYGLVRLEKAVGKLPVGREDDDAGPDEPARGWVSSLGDGFAENGLVFILQHPEGDPVRLAIDTAMSENANGTRVRYRTNTEKGSSGSPCFDINLNLAALHHSGDPNFTLGHAAAYNEGVPLGPVLTLLEQRGLREEVFPAP
jgi:hypothetical protein